MDDKFKVPDKVIDRILEGTEFDRTPEPIPVASDVDFFSKYGWWIFGAFMTVLGWLTYKQYGK